MWFDTIKKESDKPETPQSDEKIAVGVEGLLESLNVKYEGNESSISNKDWDKAETRFNWVLKEYNIEDVPNILTRTKLILSKNEKDPMRTLNKEYSSIKKLLLKNINSNFSGIEFQKLKNYEKYWKVPQDSGEKMNYELGTMFSENDGVSELEDAPKRDSDKFPLSPKGAGIDGRVRPKGKTMQERKKLMEERDKKLGHIKTPFKSKLSGSFSKAFGDGTSVRVNSAMIGYKPIHILDKQGYVFEKKHQTMIKKYLKFAETGKKHLLTKKSKSFSKFLKDNSLILNEDGQISTNKDKNPQYKIINNGSVINLTTNTPVYETTAASKKWQTERESGKHSISKLFEGDKKVLNKNFGYLMLYSLLFGEPEDLKKVNLFTVQKFGIINPILNIKETAKERNSEDSPVKGSSKEELFKEILLEGSENKTALLSKNDKVFDWLKNLVDDLERFLSGNDSGLGKGIRNLIIKPGKNYNSKTGWEVSDFVKYNGKISYEILHYIFRQMNIPFTDSQLNDDEVKSVIDLLNFEGETFVADMMEEVVLDFEEIETILGNISNREEKIIDEVGVALTRRIPEKRIEVYFGEAYKLKRITSVYLLMDKLNELEDDEIRGSTDNVISDLQYFIQALNIIANIVEVDGGEISGAAISEFKETCKNISEKPEFKDDDLSFLLEENYLYREYVVEVNSEPLTDILERIKTIYDSDKETKLRDDEIVDERNLREIIETTVELLENCTIMIPCNVKISIGNKAPREMNLTISIEEKIDVHGNVKPSMINSSKPNEKVLVAQKVDKLLTKEYPNIAKKQYKILDYKKDLTDRKYLATKRQLVKNLKKLNKLDKGLETADSNELREFKILVEFFSELSNISEINFTPKSKPIGNWVSPLGVDVKIPKGNWGTNINIQEWREKVDAAIAEAGKWVEDNLQQIERHATTLENYNRLNANTEERREELNPVVPIKYPTR